MRLKILSSMLFIIGCYVSSAFAEETAHGPVGRYCGTVYHAGYEVKSEVVFQLDAQGKITGTMHYRDDTSVTDGTVEETTVGHGTERTIQWKDKYGYGFAILIFDNKFDHFDGRWGSGISTPQYSWTGKRCNDFTS